MEKLPKITDDGFRFLVALRRALYNYEEEPDFSDVLIGDLAKALGVTAKMAQGIGVRLSVLGLIEVENCTVNREPRDFYYVSKLGRQVIEALGVHASTPVPPAEAKPAVWLIDFVPCDRELVVAFAKKLDAPVQDLDDGIRLKIEGMAQFAATTAAEDTGELPDCKRAGKEVN